MHTRSRRRFRERALEETMARMAAVAEKEVAVAVAVAVAVKAEAPGALRPE